MFVSIWSRAPRASAISRLSLFLSLLPIACLDFSGATCASAQTAAVSGGVGNSSFLVQIAPVLTSSTLPSPSLPLYGPAQGDSQSAPEAKPAGSSQDADFKKFSFETGFGANIPAGGDTGKYQTTSLGVQVGFGRNFNRRLGAQVEYDANFFGIPSSILSTYCSACSGGDVVIQSISLNPYTTFNSRGRTGAYLIGGGGFYRKSTAFKVPSGEEVCNPVYGCIPTETTAASWSNSAFGVNGGGGVTWRVGSGSSMKLFVEGRYVWINNQASSSNASSSYPPANYRTSYAPFMVGIRF